MPSSTVAALTPPNSNKIRNADAYLARQHNLLASHNSLEGPSKWCCLRFADDSV